MSVSRMIDLIRQSAVPANIMRSAAHGSLSLPSLETLEILVFLANHPIFGEQARLTLAGWDEAATLAVVSDPHVPAEVLDYLSTPENLRPRLLPAMLENPTLSESRLVELAQTGSREVLTLMLASARPKSSAEVMRALIGRPELSDAERKQIEAQLTASETLPQEDDAALPGALVTDEPGQDILELGLSDYLKEHAAEIAEEEGKPFHLIDPTTDEEAEITAAAVPAAAALASSSLAAHALARADDSESERITTVQKIARMSVGERVKCAYRGTKDERLILVRDGVRVVCTAVLESPKITQPEIEMFAAMKNVSEHVLRTIASKRKFMRKYVMKRILTSNPKFPIDVCLPLTKQLQLADLKNLTGNRNVSDTVRNFAYKVWKDKSTRER